MPELPEVETVKNTLKRLILNEKIIDVKVNYSNIIEGISKDNFINNIKNQTILDIKRRGKWLLFELDNYYLISHLRMEGKYFIHNFDDPINKHEHVIFKFKDKELRYQDTRKFGRMYLVLKNKLEESKPICELGLEPWDNYLTKDYLKSKYSKKKLPIKTVLLDQSIITGIGNIYADEILYLSKINPLTPCNSLTDINLENIIKYTKEVLERAIKLGGTTIRSYESEKGVHGKFQNELLVHNKEGEKCETCKNIIIKIKVGGRGTYYCPNCQKEN